MTPEKNAEIEQRITYSLEQLAYAVVTRNVHIMRCKRKTDGRPAYLAVIEVKEQDIPGITAVAVVGELFYDKPLDNYELIDPLTGEDYSTGVHLGEPPVKDISSMKNGA